MPAVAALAAACGGDSYFVCNDHADCGGADAVCEAVGACSFPDPECPSGRRFGGASAPSVAGECTSEESGTSDASSSSSGSSSSSSSSTTDGSSSSSSEAGSSSTGIACPHDWWDCAWAHRVQIRFTEVPASPLTAFPVLVLLGPPRIDYGDLQADGEDLRFVSARGVPLPFEVETWDPSGVSAVWVGVDEVGASSDRFFLYYGNPLAENAEDPAAVWAEPHRAVWHLGEGMRDATAHGNDASQVGNVEHLPGQIGSATRMVGNASRLTVAPSESLADVFDGGATLSAWIRPHDWGGGNFGRILHRDTGTSVGFIFFVGATGQLRFRHTGLPAGMTWTTVNDQVQLHRWSHVAVTYTAASGILPRLWIDGVEQELADPLEPPTEPGPSDAELPIEIGNRSNNDRLFEGLLDEIRIESTERSGDWIRLQHLSGRDELLAYDPPESQEVAP